MPLYLGLLFDYNTHITREHTMTQPTQKQVNTFLDALRVSGKTNMFGATPYIQKQFNITKYDAQRFLIKWMETFNDK